MVFDILLRCYSKHAHFFRSLLSAPHHRGDLWAFILPPWCPSLPPSPRCFPPSPRTQVIRCFEDDDVIHVSGSVDPERDMEIINLELALSDLSQVEKVTTLSLTSRPPLPPFLPPFLPISLSTHSGHDMNLACLSRMVASRTRRSLVLSLPVPPTLTAVIACPHGQGRRKIRTPRPPKLIIPPTPFPPSLFSGYNALSKTKQSPNPSATASRRCTMPWQTASQPGTSFRRSRRTS